MKQLALLACILVLALVGCRDDINSIEVDVEETPPIVLVESSFHGIVLTKNRQAVPNAVVQIGDNMTTSDESGAFRFKNIRVNKKGAAASAKINGYFEGIASTDVRAEGSSFLEITVVEKEAGHTFNSTNTEVITLDNEGTITIPANAIVYADGRPFTGQAVAHVQTINPLDDNFGTTMPGQLQALNADGGEGVLESYGMIALELASSTGELLEIADESQVEVSLPIPAELQASAPNPIDLWYYDLEKARWLHQGVCDKVGGNYQFVIKKSGYWNCDVFLPAVCLSGHVFNSDSTPSPYLRVTIEDLSTTYLYWGFTDIDGRFCGSVPQAASLRLTIKDLCDNIVYTEDIGPFSQDTDLDSIYLDVTIEEYLIRIAGNILQCENGNPANGLLAIAYPGRIRTMPYMSSIDTAIAFNCVEFPLLEITAYDADNRLRTTTIEHDNFSNVDLGTLEACESLDDNFSMTIDGSQNYWGAPTEYRMEPNSPIPWLIIEAYAYYGNIRLDIRNYQGPGTYTENVIFNTDANNVDVTFRNFTSASPDITVVITEDNDGIITGTLSGIIRETILPNSMPIEASFTVREER